MTLSVTLQGKYIIAHWKPGVIGDLLNKGFTLAQAQGIAKQCGGLVHIDRVKNMVVTSGLNLLANRLIGVTIAELSWHSIGTNNTAVALANTALGTEVARQQAASRSVTGAVMSMSVFYWASECAFSVKELGIWGGAASSTIGSGTLFSRALYTYDNSAGLVDMSFDYTLTLANL